MLKIHTFGPMKMSLMDGVFPLICYGTCMEKCAVQEMLTFHGQAHCIFHEFYIKLVLK